MHKLVIVLGILFIPIVYGDDNEVDFVSLSFENDAFFKDDGLYTSGLVGSWGYEDIDRLDKQRLPVWLADLVQKSYLSKRSNKRYALTYNVAQLIQTAIDGDIVELVVEDAPYVGMLAWQGQLTAYETLTLDSLSLLIGVVGPIAGAKFSQSVVHHIIGASDTKGWNQQISNEAVFQGQASRLWRIYEQSLGNSELDLITGINGGLGNFRSDIGAGVGVRLGQLLQSSFSSASVFPVQKLNRAHNSPNGWYFFANASVFYVANDIFIDGNTFQDSHSVDLIHQQYGGSFGIMANIDNWNVLYTMLQLSNQYYGQNERSRYGSITVSYHF